MATNLRGIREQGFIGYNDRIPAEFLKPGYLEDATNCLITTQEIVKRNGYTLIANDVGNNAIQGLKGVRFASGTKELLMVTNGLVYKWTGSGNWTAVSGSYTLNTSGLIDIVVANNNVYFFDGTNTVPKYDGSTMSTVAAIPIGKYARWFHNQLHVAGMSATPTTLQSSDIGDPETFVGANSSSLGVNPNDGDYITGMHELKDELIVFKQNRAWSMTGFGTSALTLADLNERITGFGAMSHFSIVNIGNDLLYVSFLGNRPVIRSLQRTRYGVLVDGGIVSSAIETTMNGLNKARLQQSVAIFDGTFAWFAFCNASDTTNNLVVTMNVETNGWMKQTGINASVFESFTIGTTPQIYFGEATADSKVYVLDTSTSDNGAAIAFSITTRRYGGDSPELKKKFKWLYIDAKEVGDYDITIDKSPDGFSYDNLGTLNLSGTGAIFDAIVLDTSKLGETDVKLKRFTIAKSRNRYMQFKMYDSSATSEVTIRNWELLYKLKKAAISTN